MLRITVESKKIKYELELKSRYTIIRGNSGSGKSALTRILTSKKLRSQAYRVTFSDDRYSVMSNDNISYMEGVDYVNAKMIIIADDYDINSDELLMLFMRECIDTYFIFMARDEFIRNLDYGIDDVYDMVTVNGVDMLIKSFTYDLYNSAMFKLPTDTVVVSEDSTYGYEFYSKLFSDYQTCYIENNGVPSGKDFVIKYLEKLYNAGIRKIFLCLDWCSFGRYVDYVRELVKQSPIGIVIMIPRALSFEYMLLCSNMFSGSFEDIPISYTGSSEQYYEDVIGKLTSGFPYGVKHGRTSKLPVCYYEKCCTLSSVDRNVWNNLCTVKLLGNDKFIALFEGTEFECLLKLSGRL